MTTTITTTTTTTTVTTTEDSRTMSENFYNSINAEPPQKWYLIYKGGQALMPEDYDAFYDFTTADLIVTFLKEAQPTEDFYMVQVELIDQ